MPTAPRFWTDPDHPLARALSPVGVLVGAIARRRMSRPPSHRAAVPVVCVGNVTVGGQGKTPLALAAAARLADMGRSPVFLSRGYGGARAGPLRVAPQHAAADVGDEPLLLAEAAPCVVSRDRAAGARLAETLGDVIVMDDGFQNPALAKSLSLIAVDAGYGFGNRRVMPAGPLRAPLGFQLSRAAAAIVIGASASSIEHAIEEVIEDHAGIPILRARLTPEITPELRAGPLVAFAGIGRPEKVFETLRGADLHVVGTRGFPDHHVYRGAEIEALAAEASRRGARLVTTAKDAARLKTALEPATRRFAASILTLRVRLSFASPAAERLDALLKGVLNQGDRMHGE